MFLSSKQHSNADYDSNTENICWFQVSQDDKEREGRRSESARGGVRSKGFQSISQLAPASKHLCIYSASRVGSCPFFLSFCLILTQFALSTVRFEMKNKKTAAQNC